MIQVDKNSDIVNVFPKEPLKTESFSAEELARHLQLSNKYKLADLLAFDGMPRSTFYFYLKKMQQPDKYTELKDVHTLLQNLTQPII